MSLANFSIKELMQNAVHFGHKAARKNAKMTPYVYGVRNGISIIDLAKTKFLLKEALDVIKEVASHNGRIFFVGTKHQASDFIKETAENCNQYYVNHRWLGGTLTNWKTVSSSIKTLERLEKRLELDGDKLTKKEFVNLEKQIVKLQRIFNGFRTMKSLPHILFVVDAVKERLAILEANKLGIPVIAIVDSNADPDGIDYVIPGNDDSKSAIQLYCRLAQAAVLEGLQQHYEDLENQQSIEADANSAEDDKKNNIATDKSKASTKVKTTAKKDAADTKLKSKVTAKKDDAADTKPKAKVTAKKDPSTDAKPKAKATAKKDAADAKPKAKLKAKATAATKKTEKSKTILSTSKDSK